jgi:uncharacterized LabA/DUF88 family protein
LTGDTQRAGDNDAALLIDWENIKYSLRNKGHRVSISALREAAEKHGRLVVARAYADWQEHREDQNNLYVAGIEPIYVPVRKFMEATGEERRRNSVDVKLTADCIELSHRFPGIGTYILVSGDQDFLHVINTLRPYGKRTVMIGVSWTTSARLAEQVDEMVYYDKDVDPIQEDTLAASKSLTPLDAMTQAVGLTDEIFRSLGLQEGDHGRMSELVRAILDVLYEYRTQGRPLLLSQLGIEVGKRAVRPFSLYGRGRLTPIISTLAAKGLLQLVDRRNVYWLFLPDEEVPPESELDEQETAAAPALGAWRSWQDSRPEVTSFNQLTEPDRGRFIAAVRDAGRELQFMSFNKLRESLLRLPDSQDWDLNRLINSAIELGILKHGEERKWMDYSTGREGIFHTFVLNLDNPDVKSRLG